jgi:predicted cupin superfamily sugar epimerase
MYDLPLGNSSPMSFFRQSRSFFFKVNSGDIWLYLSGLNIEIKVNHGAKIKMRLGRRVEN